ncbi:nucleotidyltransferase family protein [Kingella negevensis]|uniref:Nucleotidyltransferase domain protein n=1 Tax=Kingella negevensis TaxID=1522312 RepID=A0A238HH21_9NEIS|nr:nucleotidyltransferase domain-containing protein [Kingella negevensis]MDK4680757.1 nucleotidyltransferase domain-containing protein [Kingella negevensis]MDK4681520.1 nucleotidyltransferase domain-containing protein [Kingella negevensis]MDK4687827.1 nucleotidyltransferase domain-containing protein [Kingella negevensis]MDK4691907.1 nucleotidyltransferase domain-containing protein [Kingella negevensis]MDK4692940.1 nucleotidyltransferase domain-containing protein [Kingella negevensis]
MKPSQILQQHRQQIHSIILQHRAQNPRVFGSVAQGLENENSDLDILIEPQKGMALFDLGAIRSELIELTGMEVDIHTPKSLPDSFREIVLRESLVL